MFKKKTHSDLVLLFNLTNYFVLFLSKQLLKNADERTINS